MESRMTSSFWIHNTQERGGWGRVAQPPEIVNFPVFHGYFIFKFSNNL
jgi:hypothetical protein